MIKLSRFEKLQKELNAKSFKPLIDDIVNSDLLTLLSKLDAIQEWNRPKEDLFIWIPALNKIDSILSDIVKKYGYSTSDSKIKAAKLVQMNPEDENTVIILTNFTFRLLFNTENRYIYSSMDVMNDLLNCPNFKVKYGAIKVLAIIGERYIIARERLETLYKTGLPALKQKALTLALALPSSISNDDGEQFTLVDLFFDNKKYPTKWTRFKFTYYNNPNTKDLKHSIKSTTQSSGSSMRRLAFSNDDLKKFTLQQLFDKGMEVLPSDTWYDFSLKITIAKAFSEDTLENIQLRNIIIQAKFVAVAFINTVFIPPHVSSKLFEVDPYTFNSLTDFISLAESKIPGVIRLDALFALECISLKHVWCSDIMRSLGGNLSHGIMFQILRQIGKLLRNETEQGEEFSEEYNVRFFYLIYNLTEVKTLHDSLLAAGLVPSLLEIVSAKSNIYRRTMTSATHLLELFINDVDSTAEFINHNGFTLLIDCITEQVDSALTGPKVENKLNLSTIDFLIPFRQHDFIKSLLKLVLKLLKTDSGDRIRNLIDSPILGSLLKILQNMNIFGHTLITYTLDVVQRVINSEPTIYAVLIEAGIIPYIMENFGTFIKPHSDLLFLLPDLLSALCLNSNGLNEVKEKNLIDPLFKSILDPKYARELSWKEEATDLGTSLDELARHYPDLKPGIVKSFSETISEISYNIKFDVPFLNLSSNGEKMFYHSREDVVLNNEDGNKTLLFWDEQDQSAIIDCFSNLLYGMTLDNSTLDMLPRVLDAQHLLEVIVPRNAPFDYTSSQAMLNITDVLQILDEHHGGFGFSMFMDHLHKGFEWIEGFLHSPNDKSFFLGIEDDAANYESYNADISALNSISVLLHIITNVYVTLMTLSNNRVQEIIDFFQVESHLKLLTNLGLLFQKAGLEEMYIRSSLPDEVVTQTTPESFGHAPPIHIHRSKPTKAELKDDFTSARFKNTFEIRNILNRIQSTSAIMLRCFLRLSHATSMELISQDRVTELKIFDTIIRELCCMLKVASSVGDTSYLLVLLHFNTYVMTFPKTTIATTEIIQTIPAYLFYQEGGYNLYNDILSKLFSNIIGFDNVEAVEKIDYLKESEEVLTMSAVTNILTFVNKSIQQESMESIKTLSNYYVDINDYNVTTSLMKRLKLLALVLLSNLGQSYNVFHPTKRIVPYGVFKQLLTLWKNAYTLDHSSDSDDLYALRWDIIIPSESKVAVLTKVGVDGNVARNYLESHKNKLPSAGTDISMIPSEQLANYNALLSKETSLMAALISDNRLTSTDINQARNDVYRDNLKAKIFDILPSYPKLVNAIAKTLIQVFTSLKIPIQDFTADILKQIQSTNVEEEEKVSSFVHLFGIFLNESFVYQHSTNLLNTFVTHLESLLKPNCVNKTWFSKLLYCYEIILSKSELPPYETRSPDILLRYKIVDMLPVYRISEVSKKAIFDSLIRIGEITNFYSALAVSRILLIYSRESVYAKNTISSGIISRLLKVIGTFQKSEKINFLESSFLLLVRRCFETDDFVSNLISLEIDKSFTSRTLGSQKEKDRDLASLLEEKPHVVMRNPHLFTDILSETARFDDFGTDDVLLDFTMRRHLELKKKINSEEGEWKPSPPSGVIHLILSQLMAAAKKDWLSEPSCNNNKTTEAEKDSRPQPARNSVCAYMIFLLKLLAELISSYKQCKFEFLTYDRRNSYTERPRPRSTALNFFLYQLLDKNSSKDQNKDESKRKDVISMLAKSVLVGFLTSVFDANNEKLDPKKADSDLTFIRKFVIEALIKVLKSSTNSPKLLEENVNKLDVWFNIIGSMVYVQAPYLRLMIDPNKIDADRYQICRLMIELNVPAAITDCMAKLDLNYPFCKKLFNDAVETLNAINSTRSDFADFFKVESHEDDVDVEEESDKEEVPNMFRNSALGMYDVEDIEDEEDDDDEDSLIGDDGDIAFVDGEEDGYEVVFSDENESGESQNESDGSMSDSSSVEEVVIELDPEEELDEAMGIIGSEGNYEISEDEDVSSNSSNEAFDDEVQDYDSDMDIDISDYDEAESDWESGLSDLTSSEDDSDENEDGDIDNVVPVRLGNGRTLWSLGNGVELEEDASDDEQRGVFRGIQHVLNPDEQMLFRVHEASNRGNNHQRSFRRHPNSSMVPPSMSLLNGNRRNQSNLINPLGPSGLEQVENDITAQMTTVGTGIRPRLGRPHFADVLFSGELLDERILDGIVMKSSIARWKDIFDMFYDSKNYANYLIPAILNRVFRSSLELYQVAQKRKQEKSDKMKEERNKKQKLSPPVVASVSSANHTSGNSATVAVSPNPNNTLPEDHDPSYVNIEGTEVDIAGTDIDPEFLNALPEDMRAEVFSQHIRERRADATHNNFHSREVDSDFLDTIPEDIRDEILEQEAAEERLSSAMRGADDSSSDDSHDYDMIQDVDIENNAPLHPDTSVSSIHDTLDEELEHEADEQKKKQGKAYFEPLIDRQGTAALMKCVFISQPYIQREIYHELFYKLCSSKQNRNDIVNMLLMILKDGTVDQNSLEKVYNMMISRSQNNIKSASSSTKQLPPDTTPLVVANQAIEILQYLIDSDAKVKFFFITEHESLLVSKNKKDEQNKRDKLPLKHLFSLFDRKLITDETVLMDLLTNILQTCTKPFRAIVKNKIGSPSKKKFQVPSFDVDELRRIVSIIRLDSCSTKVFQQTLNILYYLCAVEGSFKIFTEQLTNMARITSSALISDIEALTKEVEKANFGSELEVDLVQKLTLPSSEQAKLLKVLTTVDYLHTHKKKEGEYNTTELIGLYNKMNLGKLWVTLSRCMFAFEQKKNISTSATLLLPVIESLMVVCKHCNIFTNESKSATFRESKIEDLESVAVENLFVPFTDQHKKLLNQMIRSNPKLMSGPFSLLVKNSKVLDFDNKRYYFIAKLRSENHERPKLPITVRRDQVFLDSYRALFFKTNDEIKNSKLEITFKGESGVDAGGLTREWYQVLSRQMFNPGYALFLPVASDKTTFHPNRTSGINPEHLSFFKFTGMIIAKAIRDQCFLDCHFSREVYKSILDRPVSLKDMESLDPDYYKSLVWILENDITDIIEETFSVETDDYGEHKVINLIQDGSNIAVTEANKQEYVKSIVEYKLNTSVKEQMDNFLVGFYALIPKELITIFDEQEVELLISGLPDIDVDDWKNNTTYVNYTGACKQVNYFWRAVRSFDVEERAKLLQFVTGTSKVPLNGFKELSGVNGTCKFSIHRDYGSVERLPSSHTCFNQLNLPAYNSYEALRGALLHAINEGSEGFGLA